MKKIKTFTLSLLSAGFLGLVLASPVSAAVVTDNVPDQASCDDGSVMVTWDDEVDTAIGVDSSDRPIITSMTVDGETVPDPTSPADGSIGAAICANFANARKVGLFVYRRDGINAHMDLAGAETPGGDPITADSEISITVDFRTLAQYYSFSLVHGDVLDWQPTGLGTEDAQLSVTMRPTTTPLVDYEAEGAQFCTATPPVCEVESSEMDVLSASFDMDFDQEGAFAAFTGSYFGLTGATGGFVQASGNTLQATLGGPHFLEDGTTLNQGRLQAFLPDSVLENILQLNSETADESSFSVAREEDGEVVQDDAPFSVTPVDGGLVIEMTDFHFSTPTFVIAAASGSSGSGGTGGTSATGGNGGSLAATGSDQLALLLAVAAVIGSSYLLYRRTAKELG